MLTLSTRKFFISRSYNLLLLIYLFCFKSDLKSYMNAYIIKTQIFHILKFDLKCHWRSILNFVKRFRYLLPILMKILEKAKTNEDANIYYIYFIIWSLTYVLMDNFCPCLSIFYVWILLINQSIYHCINLSIYLYIYSYIYWKLAEYWNKLYNNLVKNQSLFVNIFQSVVCIE